MKKSLSFLLAITFLNFTLSCSTPQHVIVEKINNSIDANEYLILHRGKEIYRIYEYSISEIYLKGKLHPFTYEEGKYTHIYTKANIFDTAHYDAKNNLTLPIDEIDRIVYKVTSVDNTLMVICFIILCVAATVVGITGIGAPEISFSIH